MIRFSCNFRHVLCLAGKPKASNSVSRRGTPPLHSSQSCRLRVCVPRHNFSSTVDEPRPSPKTDSIDDSRKYFMGSSLSRLLTNDQRTLLRRVHQLSASSRSLARKVGNVQVREDSLLADIAKLQAQRRGRATEAAPTTDSMTDSTSVDQKVDVDEVAPPSLFTVVFAGEFNSGKSTLINALLGKELLEAGVLPTTDAITILMAANEERNKESAKSKDDETVDNAIIMNSDELNMNIHEHTHHTASFASTSSGSTPTHTQLHLLPTSSYPILSDLCLIDTPGTNAILSLQHTSSTLRILHDADLIVFVTSADRPFSESEKELLRTSIKSYRKRVVLVINKMDILERQKGEDHGEKTKLKVIDYVTEHAGDLLGARPVVIPLSARDALSVKLLYNKDAKNDSQQQSSSLWKRSNFATLEDYLSSTLTATTKIKTKLLNPLGVAEGILLDCQQEIERRLEELEVDVMTLRLLTSQTEAWEKELQTEVMDEFRLDVRKSWEQKADVVDRVIDELSIIDQFKLLVGRKFFDLAWERSNRRGINLSSSTFETQGNNQNSLEKELLSFVISCAERISTRAKSQGDATIEYLGKRPAIIGSGGKVSHSRHGVNRMVGTISTPKFHRLEDELRQAMTAAVQRAARHLRNDSDNSDHVYKSLRQNALVSALLCGSAFGPVSAYLLEALDFVPSLVAGTSLVALGTLALPLGNRNASKSYKTELMSHATKLDETLDTLFKDAIRRVAMQLSDGISPYSRYVRTEGDLLNDLRGKMERNAASAHSLRNRINKSFEL